MDDRRLALTTSLAALVGGTAWVVAVVLHALQPRGCVGEECLTRPQREATPATSWLVVLAGVALVVFCATLLALLGRSGQLGRAGRTGIAACLAGVAALVVMGLPGVRDQVRPLPGMVAVAVGLVLVAWSVVRSRSVPTWAGAGLLVGVVSLAGFGEQTSRVLFALPFGLAWLATGIALLPPPRSVSGDADPTAPDPPEGVRSAWRRRGASSP